MPLIEACPYCSGASITGERVQFGDCHECSGTGLVRIGHGSEGFEAVGGAR